MSSSEQKIARAKALRDIALNHFTLIETSSTDAKQNEAAKMKFKVTQRNLKKVIKDFEKHHNTLITLISNDPDELIAENKVYEGFIQRVHEVETICYELFELPLEPTPAQTLHSTLNLPSDNHHLPKLKLKTFSGDMAEFPAFHQMFVSSVHANRSMSNTEKFNYLVSVLSGPALELIEDIPIIPDNYQTAYNIILERYNNKREQAFTHWHKIESFLPLQKEDATLLRNLLLTFTKNLSVLKIMGLAIDNWDFILSYMLLNRLDPQTRKAFEQKHASNEIPKFDDLKSFIEKQCIALEAASASGSYNTITCAKNYNKSKISTTATSYKNFNNARHSQNKSAFLIQSTDENKCFVCDGNHIIFHCPVFKSKGPKQRFEIIKQKKACVNCLATLHSTVRCTSSGKCKICQKSHHTMLHFDDKRLATNKMSNTIIDETLIPSSSTNINCNDENNQQLSRVGMLLNADYEVLLSTAMVKIKDNFNQWFTVRAVLDSGAQSSFITRALANRLGLKKIDISMSLQGLGEMLSTAHSGVKTTISSLTQPDYFCNLEMVIIDKISDELPATSFSVKDLPFIENLNLADPNFNKKSKIDLLLGNDIFPYILKDGKFVLGNDKPVYLNTVFGWTIMGKFPQSASKTSSNKVLSLFAKVSNTTLDNILQKFWSLEEVPQVKSISSDDKFCENYYTHTTTRNTDGKYVVALPFKITNPDFGNTREIALRRFLSLEKRLLQNEDFYFAYSNVLQDYLDQNHITKVSAPSNSELNSYFYIPHHAVIKNDSSTTPLRVVFDASSHDVNKPSLNQALYVGPKLQNDLVKLLIIFRIHKYVFTCDIRQMYRMIWVAKDHRQYQRILWRFSQSEPVSDFELNTVTFGINCAPFLAIRTILQLAEGYRDKYPLAAKVLEQSSYVDDVIEGDNSLDVVITMKNELIQLLREGGFEAHKWASNFPQILQDLPGSFKQNINISLDLENDNVLKILGLKWDSIHDTFFFSITVSNKKCTKRNILSDLARVFDPLGFLTPCTFFAKLLIQHLWVLGLGWDEEPPTDILTNWKKFKCDLPVIQNVKIPREIITINASSFQLFGFCDASTKGYCGVVYVRIIYKNCDIKTFLVCAKSKVAPLKQLTVPRLELCAAVLLSKLMQFVIETFKDKINFSEIFAFTDSSVTLQWIRSSPHRWQTFISNRISYIQERTPPNIWYHVPSEVNPADCGSRGIYPNELIDNKLWWHGPTFLQENVSSWNFSTFLPAEDSDDEDLKKEKRNTALNVTVTKHFVDDLLQKFNSFSKIKRILAYILRAIHNLRNRSSKKFGSLTLIELTEATLFAASHIQSIHFNREISLVKNKDSLPKYFASLNPFIDEKGLLRVGGRLAYSNVSYDKKFPVLLPNNSKFTSLLINDIHVSYLHCGIQTTHFLLSQNFWIISAKKIIRTVLSQCHTCWKIKPKTLQPPMGNLPKFRISQARAFLNVGVDFCGPFTITASRIRGAKILKSYVCLFICCATKAVHLELVSDMSSEAFLAALRRLIARRGRCLNIYSDCGTNFIGAENYLRQIFRETAESESVSWHFNPPYAPHMGGIWEGNIKSFKTHLMRVVGQQILTYEELNTVIIQIESVLNSRPLCAMSSDPNDLAVLTPGHFLTLEPLTNLPDPDMSDCHLNRLTRWQLLQRIHRDFWKRWHREYLHTLQQRFKWTKSLESIAPGAMVVIKNDNAHPLEWSLGRISELISGADGIPRVAVVKTSKGLIKRPLVKLCLLPNND